MALPTRPTPAPAPIELGHGVPVRRGSLEAARQIARLGALPPRPTQPAPVGRRMVSPKPATWIAECALPVQHKPAVPIPEDARFPERLKVAGRAQPPPTCQWQGSVTIACVLRRGPDFGREEVNRLHRAVARNLTRPFRFVVLTDDHGPFADGVEIVPLAHPEWTTKHSKLELFRPALLKDFGRTLYLDLDTVVMGSLEDICTYDGDFAMLRDFFYSLMNGSGLMAWGGEGAAELSEIYFDFLEMAPAERMARYPIGGGLGDQLFIRHHTPIAPHQIQDPFPGQIGSYKAHFHGLPEPAQKPRVVCFHGKPKPGAIGVPWIREHYDR